MNNVFKVSFYPRKNYIDKKGEVAIRVFLFHNSERTQFTSDLTISLEMWDDDENRVFGNSPKVKVINNKLEDIESTLKFHSKELLCHEISMSVLQVRCISWSDN